MNIFQKIAAWITGAAKKIREALAFGKDAANTIKKYADSPILDAIVMLTPTDVDDKLLAYVRAGLTSLVEELNWADKKVSDFSEDSLPHAMNALNAEAAYLRAKYQGLNLSRQQTIAAAQVVYDGKIVA